MLISSKELHREFDNLNLIILDASQQKKQNNLEGIQIKGARFFDLKIDFSDTNSQFPNTFPTTQKFENSCKKLGINKTSKIVVYDKTGVFSSPRVWWMFRSMGHKNVFVLNGGLPDWILSGYKTEKPTLKRYKQGNFTATFNTKNVRHIDFIKQNIITQETTVIDVRSSERFHSLVPEPRPNLRSGHILNSINLPFSTVLDNGKFASTQKLKAVFSKVKTNKALVFSCGSGITACIVLFASELILNNEKSVYDGSWTEYGCLVNQCSSK